MVRFRRLAAATAGLTFALILLGVYTAAAGAGLTCAGRWPLCDGAVFGLFPADWLSFVEWFHRLVAMVTGFAILGTAYAAWRRRHRSRWALTLAAVLLPAQVGLGALTVTEYEWLVLTAHFVTALTIFTGVALAALWATDGPPFGVRKATSAALVAFPVLAALSPRVLVVYSATVQVTYYALGLAVYVALLAATVRAPADAPARTRWLAGAAAAVVFGLLALGRQPYGDVGQLVTLAATLLAFALTAGVVIGVRNSGRDRTRTLVDTDT